MRRPAWTAVLAGLGRLLRDASDAAFDPRCAAGDHPLRSATGPACASCTARLHAEALGARCEGCSAGSVLTACGACSLRPRRVRIEAPRSHHGVSRALILALKAARREDVARPLALATFGDERARQALLQAEVVVPVPAHPVRRRERGFNPAESLARAMARLAARTRGRRLPVRMALRARATAGKQSTRSAIERRRALRASLVALPAARWLVAGRRVVLVDDVVTTGATAAEAARLLLRAGASSVCVVACTRAEGTVLDAPHVPGLAGAGVAGEMP